jgi:hypothetical protein
MRDSGPMLEARVDRPGADGARLVAGAAVAEGDRDISGLVGTLGPPGSDPPATFAPFADDQHRTAATFYLDYDQKLAEHTRLLLGGRVAAADDMKPVWRPRVSLRHHLGPKETLVLLTRPVLSDDISELSPVEQWSLTDWLSPLDLARGGYSQSYELQYERLSGQGTLLRLAAFHRDLRNLLVDLDDPRLSAGAGPTLVGSGSLQGLELEAERWLGRDLSGGAQVVWLDSNNDDAGGLDLPYQPSVRGQVRLDYLDANGWRGSLVMEHVGRRYADLAATTRLGSVSLWHLTLAKQQDLHIDLFLTVSNLFGKDTGFWQDYGAGGRKVRAGVEYRF